MSRLSSDAFFASVEDHARCRAAIRQGSRSFFAASLVLPRAVRRPAYGLYAFCRLSDDAVDLAGRAPDAIARLRLRLDRVCEGRPLPFPADRAMADLMRDYAIPREVPEALLEGLTWDAEERRYETFDDLLDYAARVAGTVGVMMTLLMGVRDPEALARACDLGCAMQLTNIARDVGEDARAGRLYLPLAWLRDADVDPDAFVGDPRTCPALAAITARLLAEADAIYARAQAGIARLPLSCRPAILAAALIYAEIGRALEALSHDSIGQRARVSGRRKLELLARAVATAPTLAASVPAPALPQVAFLIDAVARHPAARLAPRRKAAAPRDLVARFVRVLDMFERLERAGEFGD